MDRENLARRLDLKLATLPFRPHTRQPAAELRKHRDVVILAELLRCAGDLGGRLCGKCLCAFEPKQIALSVACLDYTVRDPEHSVIRLKLDLHFFPGRLPHDAEWEA